MNEQTPLPIINRPTTNHTNQVAPTPMTYEPVAEETLYEWQAPSRLYKKRNREFYTTVGAIILLLSIILLFAKEFLLVAVVVSVGFVAYALASVKPDDVFHRLTTRGIRTGNTIFVWESLGRFWEEEKWHQVLFHVEQPYQFPGKLVLLVGEGDIDEIEAVLAKYLVKQKPEPTFLDKASTWLQEKVPLEVDEA